MNANPDRPTGPLKLVCPACEYVNEFPAEDTLFLFVCSNCGEPIGVDEGDSEA
jgi:hypothetical protein